MKLKLGTYLRARECPIVAGYLRVKENQPVILADEGGTQIAYRIDPDTDIAYCMGVLHSPMHKRLMSAAPKEEFKYRNKRMRRLTNEEIENLVDGKVFLVLAN